MNKVWQILALLFALSSYKSLPLAYYVRFYGTIMKTLIFPKHRYRRLKKNTFGISTEQQGQLAIFTSIASDDYVSPLEYDMFLHKSNSSYFIDLDIARTKLLCLVLQTGFYSYMDNDYKDYKRRLVFHVPYTPVAEVECLFKKELKLFEKYQVVSRIGAWDDKWVYVISKFVKTKDKRIVAIAITRYVFKLGRVTIPPEVMIKRSGLLTEAAIDKNKEYVKLFQDHNADQIAALVETF